MRQVTATEKLRAVNEGMMAEAEFVRQMRQLYPMHITQYNGFKDTVQILKNKGMLFEEKEEHDYAKHNNISVESLRRAIDIELEAMGLMSHGNVSFEDQEKAKKKALKNLEKDPLHYYNLISGESSKVDKHDKATEFKKGKEVDTFNGLKKAELKEEFKKQFVASIPEIKKFLENKLSSDHDKDVVFEVIKELLDGIEFLVDEQPGTGELEAAYSISENLEEQYDEEEKPQHLAVAQEITKLLEPYFMALENVNEASQEESIADFIIKHYTNPKTGKSLIDDEIIGDFFKTHPEAKDQEPQEALDSFDEYLFVNYDIPSAGDAMEEKVAKSVEDVIDPADYGDIGRGYLKGFNRPHSLSDDDLEVLGRKVTDKLFKGDFDAAKAKFVGEVMGIDRKGNQKPETEPSRFKGRDKSVSRAVAAEALSDEDMKAIEKYGHADKPVKAFKPGDMFSSDFDYEGMLEFGLKIRLNTPVQTLQALYDSFEDVNYHSENQYLGNAIDAIKDGDKSDALDNIRNFKKAVKQTLIGINEGGTPVRELEEGDPMTMAYTKKVKDIKEGRGDMDMIVQIIDDRAAESGFEPNEEAAEVIAAIADHYKLNLKMIQNYLDSDEPVNPFSEESLEEEPNEGNKFEEERLKAIKAGKKEFSVDGKTFPVKGADAEDKKRAKMVKENVKAIIQNVLKEELLNEAATNNLADWGAGYEGFEGVKSVVNTLENIVTEIESFYDKIGDKIAKAMAGTANFRNDEGLKIGAFIAPSLEAAFKKDLRPIQKAGFLNKVELPKVRTITQADIDAHNSGERPLGEQEPAKQHVFTPAVNENEK